MGTDLAPPIQPPKERHSGVSESRVTLGTHPELSTQILHRKISRIADTQAQIVTTACPACIMQIAGGLRRHGMPEPTKHVVELVADSLLNRR